MKEKKIAIITCSYNQEKLLEKCLDSIKKKTTYKNYRVYFIDDSGIGKIGNNIKKKLRWVNVTTNKKNIGFSGSNNIGIKIAMKEYNPDYLLLLNDDCEIVDREWLRKIVKVGESDKKIGILGCRIIYPDGRLQNMGGYLKGWNIIKELNEDKKEVFEVDHVMGACIFIKKEVIKKIGFLDERYNPFLLEDTDYCLNAKKHGFKVVSVPFVRIIHKKGKSIDSLRNKDIIKVRFNNDIYFSRKNLSGWNKAFRIFVFLPMVAVFRKKNDEDSLNLINFRIRKEFLRNIIVYFKSLIRGYLKKVR